MTALCERFGIESVALPTHPKAPESFHIAMSSFRIDRAIDILFNLIDSINSEIADRKPWEISRDEMARDEVSNSLKRWGETLYAVGYWLRPFCPETAGKICGILSSNPIRKPDALFPRRSRQTSL